VEEAQAEAEGGEAGECCNKVQAASEEERGGDLASGSSSGIVQQGSFGLS